MTGGEGKIMLLFDQQIDDHTQIPFLKIVGADAGDGGLQVNVAHQKTENQGKCHTKTGFSILFCNHEQHRNSDPEDAGIAKNCDDGHQEIQRRTPEICSNPVKDRQVEADCQRIQQRWVFAADKKVKEKV